MPIGYDFQRRYATIVLDLEQLNKDLNKVLHEVQQYCYKVNNHWLLHTHLNIIYCKFALFSKGSQSSHTTV